MKKNPQRRLASAPNPGRWHRRLAILVGISIAAGSLLFWRHRGVREAARLTNNLEKLAGCDPTFAVGVARVIQSLESAGYRPWIRESWRSPVDQERAYAAGQSEIRLGFHNVTGKEGEHRAFAVDIVETIDLPHTKPQFAVTLARITKC